MIIRFPDHDWTIRLGGKSYGLIEYDAALSGSSLPRHTVILFGRYQKSVNASIFTVAAVPILILLAMTYVVARFFGTVALFHKGEATRPAAPT